MNNTINSPFRGSGSINIALIGYGKMGKAIEQIALQRGHTIVLKIDINNAADFNAANMAKADVAIEFTTPHTAFDNISNCLNFGVPVISGSTGWTERINEIKKLCAEKNGSFLYASNYSVGVNIFFEVNKRLAQLMAPHNEYNVSMTEIHHTEKKDAPSGTAITLAEQILEEVIRKTKWVNTLSPSDSESVKENELEIKSERTDPAPGTHSIKYSSSVDDIEIIHTAHNRTGFALGALLAAEFVHNKKGVFSMKDVLSL
jgi:4-hydroxy-tetrahydrodipicolinate reductase